MTRLSQILRAVRALAGDALPQAKVLGLNGDDAGPRAIPGGGLVVVRAGDPGEPQVDLSPPQWNWDYQAGLEVSAVRSATKEADVALDEMLAALDAAFAADPTLGGLCDWAQLSGPMIEDLYVEGGGRPPRGADLTLTITYTTSSPLG